ncbi:MAG: hypothetical protein IJM83_01870 [Firmicutes bacterium]|nr:hypothetical protein [Bacillota bacterium]
MADETREPQKQKKRNRHTGAKTLGAVLVLAALMGGGYYGLGIGQDVIALPGVRPSQAESSTVQETSQASETQQEAATPAESTAMESENPAKTEDDVLEIVIREDKIEYEGNELSLQELEEALLKDYTDQMTVTLTDDHAIKATYDEVTALLEKLTIPYTQQ